MTGRAHLSARDPLDPVPHLDLRVPSRGRDLRGPRTLRRAGVSNILSLGGDAPKGQEYRKADERFQHAIDLVKFIRKFINGSGLHPGPAGIGNWVAGSSRGSPGHASNRLLEDGTYLKQKVDAGADYVVTQLFFE